MPKSQSVRVIAVTNPLIEIDNKKITADELMAFIARVSNPKNQTNLLTMPKLLGYCANNKHWSVFEMADMTVEIKTSRAIAQQILRHRSFTFQEFSQRYAPVTDYILYEARRQDTKNRQNSLNNMSTYTQWWFRNAQRMVWTFNNFLYKKALKVGVAKECARFLLPLNTQTTMYMKGNVRSWIHYIDLRADGATQFEHREIAGKIKEIFCKHYPITAEAVGWQKAKMHN